MGEAADLSVASRPTGTHMGPGSRRPQAQSPSRLFIMASKSDPWAASDMMMVLLMSKLSTRRCWQTSCSSLMLPGGASMNLQAGSKRCAAGDLLDVASRGLNAPANRHI